MQAIVIDGFGGPERLQLRELPDPEPGPGEVRVRVAAAGVNPADWKFREGLVRPETITFPFVPGIEVAGVVDRVGAGVDDVAVGDDVMAMVWEGYAELVVAEVRNLAPRPGGLDVLRAAALPIVALTAAKAVEDIDVRAGEVVLVHAAAGGVGGVAVALSASRGAHVIGTASARNHDHVRSLGAAAVIDHGTDVVAAVARLAPGGVDVVIDCFGGPALTASAAMLRPGGRLIDVVAAPPQEPYAARGATATLLGNVRADGAARLPGVAQLVVDGGVPLHLEHVYPFADVAAAQIRSQEGHVRGKLVLDLR